MTNTNNKNLLMVGKFLVLQIRARLSKDELSSLTNAYIFSSNL